MKIHTILLTFLLSAVCFAAPVKPDKYLTDQSHLVSEAKANEVNEQLAQFERDTSTQFLVYITPELPEDDINLYTTELFNSWKVGQTQKNNGVVLFIFSDKKKAAIRTGYGLEGVLPDGLCTEIRKDTLGPLWKAGKYDQAIDATVGRIILTAKGEYKGNGSTVYAAHTHKVVIIVLVSLGILFLLIIIIGPSGSGSSRYSGSSYGGDSGGGSSGGGGGGGWGSGGGDSGGGGSGGDM